MRLAKSRSRAAALVAEGRVRIDGRPAPNLHADVRAGHTLTFMYGTQVRAIRILALPVRRGPAPEAQGCYEDLIVPDPIDASGR